MVLRLELDITLHPNKPAFKLLEQEINISLYNHYHQKHKQQQRRQRQDNFFVQEFLLFMTTKPFVAGS